MPKPDPHIAAHLEWLGFVRPTGLVVSAPVLAQNGATLNRHDAEGQRRQACVEERRVNGDAAPQPVLPDFPTFAQSVLDWRFSPKAYAGTPEAPMPPETGSTPAGHRRNPASAVRHSQGRNIPNRQPAREQRQRRPRIDTTTMALREDQDTTRSRDERLSVSLE